MDNYHIIKKTIKISKLCCQHKFSSHKHSNKQVTIPTAHAQMH